MTRCTYNVLTSGLQNLATGCSKHYQRCYSPVQRAILYCSHHSDSSAKTAIAPLQHRYPLFKTLCTYNKRIIGITITVSQLEESFKFATLNPVFLSSLSPYIESHLQKNEGLPRIKSSNFCSLTYTNISFGHLYPCTCACGYKGTVWFHRILFFTRFSRILGNQHFDC